MKLDRLRPGADFRRRFSPISAKGWHVELFRKLEL